jgi:hypothetical protein
MVREHFERMCPDPAKQRLLDRSLLRDRLFKIAFDNVALDPQEVGPRKHLRKLATKVNERVRDFVGRVREELGESLASVEEGEPI